MNARYWPYQACVLGNFRVLDYSRGNCGRKERLERTFEEYRDCHVFTRGVSDFDVKAVLELRTRCFPQSGSALAWRSRVRLLGYVRGGGAGTFCFKGGLTIVMVVRGGVVSDK